MIETAEQLARPAYVVNDFILQGNGRLYNDLSVYYALARHIVLNDTDGWESRGDTAEPANSWTPIGRNVANSDNFDANFDGRGCLFFGFRVADFAAGF